MNKSLLIIVSGPPCSGKTTLVKKVSEKFQIPLITKDSIKEIIFENLGWNDREWSKKVGAVSYKLLFYLLDSILISKNPLIIESNFKAELDTQLILEKITKYGYFPIQVMCECNGQVLVERFKKRSELGERHPGHVDQNNYEEFKEILLKGKTVALDMGGEIIKFDTTDLNNLDFEKVFSKIQQFI